MSTIHHIVNKSYLGDTLISHCLPTLYNDLKSKKYQNIALVSALLTGTYD